MSTAPEIREGRALQAKEVSWADTDKGVGRWQLYTLCRGCGEMRDCRGKERDRVLCHECFFADVPALPLFDEGVCGFDSREDAVAYFTTGRRQRAARLNEERAERLREANRRKAAATRERNIAIAQLVDDGHSYELVAERFDVTVASAKTLAKRGRRELGVELRSTAETVLVGAHNDA